MSPSDSAESPLDRAHALTRSAQAHRDAGDLSAALEHQAAAANLYRGAGNARRLAHTVRHLGDMLLECGRYDDAAGAYEEMIAYYRSDAATPPLELANAVRSIALHAEMSGDRERAEAHWSEARERYLELGARLLPGVEEADRHLAHLRQRR